MIELRWSESERTGRPADPALLGEAEDCACPVRF
jgi:hypothetical protein